MLNTNNSINSTKLVKLLLTYLVYYMQGVLHSTYPAHLVCMYGFVLQESMLKGPRSKNILSIHTSALLYVHMCMLHACIYTYIQVLCAYLKPGSGLTMKCM